MKSLCIAFALIVIVLANEQEEFLKSSPDSNQEIVILDKGDDSFAQVLPSADTVSEAIQEEYAFGKIWSILSVIATSIPYIILIYGVIIEKKIGKSDPDAFVVFGYFFMFIVFPLNIASIVFGCIGLWSSLRWLSLISMIMSPLSLGLLMQFGLTSALLSSLFDLISALLSSLFDLFNMVHNLKNDQTERFFQAYSFEDPSKAYEIWVELPAEKRISIARTNLEAADVMEQIDQQLKLIEQGKT